MTRLLTLNKYFKRNKGKLSLGILFILISDLTQVYIPLVLKDSIDTFKNNPSIDLIINYAIIIFVLAVVSGFFRYMIRQTIIVVSRKIEFDIRQDFWVHLLKLSHRYFQNTSTGNIMAHATNDIGAVRMYVGPAVMYSIDTAIKFIIVIAIMLSISPILTVYTLIPLPILSYFVYKLSKKIHKKFTLIQEKFSDITTMAQENFSGIRIIKSYVREAFEIEKFAKESSEYRKRNMDKIKIQALFTPLLFLITGTSIILLILIGGNMIIDGKLTLGDIAAFMFYLGLLIWPTIAFGWVANIIQQADASLKRLQTIYSEDIEIKENAETDNSITEIKGTIKFENVSFKYRDNLPEVLNNISLIVPQGSTLAIVGHTGVGKTSFVNLVSRLFDVTAGNIFIDGKNIKSIPLNVLRENVGMVPQETFLFSDTLQNNILYGIEKTDEIMLHKVAEIAQLTKDVNNFPKKFETILGERGITLSGGQKQRTCLARALAINPKILILDDSFSAVDTKTEEEILVKLKEFMKDRTSIIISHRISTVKDADNIIVLDNGIIKEQGTHEELLEMSEIYYDIHFKQLLEEELEREL
ncbi:MAG: ABC transporter ATP-binding protein/permease [Bacteroidetes bacterium]|nr:ABC transporter ATP-binding protein/permease [Bacteroidota bacterium]MBU1116347.1 ABC transporter ATP-binding protein/permease [Bacteroidota bacterium]MBU1796920.1 ABC transporter ATP-binding protein/permease [Bacteroidota bacterium]